VCDYSIRIDPDGGTADRAEHYLAGLATLVVEAEAQRRHRRRSSAQSLTIGRNAAISAATRSRSRGSGYETQHPAELEPAAVEISPRARKSESSSCAEFLPIR